MDESGASCIVDKVIPNYIDYAYTNYKRLSTSAYYVPLDISWYKITKDTIEMRDWKDQYATIDSPVYTTTYLQQIYHSSGLVNIDSRTIFIDTALAPLFYPSMQWDSSAYFTNATSPISSTNTYIWDFGDGSATSTDVNPFHTFPAFDSNYVVCLTATNRCGSYTYCDTVWIDSLHLGGSFKVTAVRHPESSEGTLDASYLSKTNVTSNCQLSNYPNPFDQSTIIDYEIWQTYSKAELRITNVLGQEVYIQRLNRPMDKVQIDGSALHNGLYYYSLIVDGAVKLTKTMSVIR
jgi:PKD repeat protein